MEEIITNALREAEEAVSRTKTILDNCNFPHDSKSSMTLTILKEMLEEHNRVLQSCREAEYCNAMMQGRKLLGPLIKGLWLHHGCGDADSARDEADLVRSPLRMTQELDRSLHTDEHCDELRKRLWRILAKYEDLQLEQVGKLRSQNSAEPAYKVSVIKEVVVTSTTCVLMLAGDLLRTCGFSDTGLDIKMYLSTGSLT